MNKEYISLIETYDLTHHKAITLYLTNYIKWHMDHYSSIHQTRHVINVLYKVLDVSIEELLVGYVYIEGENEVEVRSALAPKLQLIITI